MTCFGGPFGRGLFGRGLCGLPMAERIDDGIRGDWIR